VATRASVSREPISRLERGVLDGLTVRTLRRVFHALDADLALVVRWRGGELDRVLDRGHAALGGSLIDRFDRRTWGVAPEVSYSEYGERGAIDVLGWHGSSRCLLVIEVKTELTSIEETLRRHDVKARLAARIARERFGWDPLTVSRLLVLPDESTARRRVSAHDGILRRAYPHRGQSVRRWLANPSGSIAGLMFLSPAGKDRTSRRHGPTVRVRDGHSRSAGGDDPPGASHGDT